MSGRLRYPLRSALRLAFVGSIDQPAREHEMLFAKQKSRPDLALDSNSNRRGHSVSLMRNRARIIVVKLDAVDRGSL